MAPRRERWVRAAASRERVVRESVDRTYKMSAVVTMANFSAEMTSPVETMSTTHGPAVAATLARVFRDVWTASLDGLETATCTCATPTHPSVAARVDFLGDWRGEIALCLPEELANHVGATMFMMPPEDLSDADVRDAVGELCNMVGGNIRAALSRRARWARRTSSPARMARGARATPSRSRPRTSSLAHTSCASRSSREKPRLVLSRSPRSRHEHPHRR